MVSSGAQKRRLRLICNIIERGARTSTIETWQMRLSIKLANRRGTSSGWRAVLTRYLLKFAMPVASKASFGSDDPVFTRNLPKFAAFVAEVAALRPDQIANHASGRAPDGRANSGARWAADCGADKRTDTRANASTN